MIRTVFRGAKAPSSRWGAGDRLVTLVVIGLLALSCGVPVAAHGAATTTIQVAPCEVPDEQPPRINPGDAPTGFGPDSWQGPASGKSNWHAAYLADGDKLSALFPADAATLKIADLAAISYFTKRPAATPAGRDWWVMIYTRPTGSHDKASWYHDRYINNYGAHTETAAWTQYSTASGMTFVSNGWGDEPVMSLAQLITAHGGDLIGAISIQTDSGWPGFDGYVDGLEITLTNGNIGQVNLGSALSADDRYVDDTGGIDGTNSCLTSAAPCATIQRAVDVACAGGTVHVAAGTYKENVVVTKSVALVGAGQGVSIIQPAVSNPNPCSGSSLCGGAASNIILVQADNVTIHDFTLDGNNPSVSSGLLRGGVDIDARNGIVTNYYTGNVHNLEVYSTTVQNVYLRGVYSSSQSSGNTFNFHDNTVHNVQGDYYSIAMFNFAGGGIMAHNTVSDANDAISANWSQGTQFLDNVITNSGSGVHSDNNGGYGGTADLIEGNTVADCQPYGFGIWVFAPYFSTTVSGNSVANCAVGLSVAGQATTAGVPVFSNNQVDGGSAPGSAGVYITTSLFGWGAADVNATFTNNLIVNNDQGFYLQDKTCSVSSTQGCNADADCPTGETCLVGTSVTLNASCNLISGNDTGILTENLSTPANVGFSGCSIVDNGIGADGTAIASGSINATGNWWGCAAGPGGYGCDTVTAGVNASSPAPAPPICVNCVSDADCDDVLACNGAETCNTSTHVCQAGTPKSCPADACHVGTCTEPSGTCGFTTKSDGASCNDGDICQAGVCTGANTLSVATVRLVRNHAKSPTRPNGSVYVNAIVNDADTGGTLVDDLHNEEVTLSVRDGGSFSVTFTLRNCSIRGNGNVSCKDPSSRTSATSRRIRRHHPQGSDYGVLYKIIVHRTGLGTSETGTDQPIGPVHVILHQTLVDRPEVITPCVQSGNNRLVCHD